MSLISRYFASEQKDNLLNLFPLVFTIEEKQERIKTDFRGGLDGLCSDL